MTTPPLGAFIFWGLSLLTALLLLTSRRAREERGYRLFVASAAIGFAAMGVIVFMLRLRAS